MNRMALACVAGLVVAAATVAAQEPEEAERREPVRRIRVLEDPYQIASFYRSSQGPSAPVYFGAAPLTDRSTLADRYAIASYYRLGGSGRGKYSRFWTSSAQGSSFGSSRRFVPIRSRRIGPAELCLFAPTFLAPVAPLADLDR